MVFSFNSSNLIGVKYSNLGKEHISDIVSLIYFIHLAFISIQFGHHKVKL